MPPCGPSAGRNWKITNQRLWRLSLYPEPLEPQSANKTLLGRQTGRILRQKETKSLTQENQTCGGGLRLLRHDWNILGWDSSSKNKQLSSSPSSKTSFYVSCPSHRLHLGPGQVGVSGSSVLYLGHRDHTLECPNPCPTRDPGPACLLSYLSPIWGCLLKQPALAQSTLGGGPGSNPA